MQPFPKNPTEPVGKIIRPGDIVVDPSKIVKIDPDLLKKLFPPTCASTFDDHFSTIKQQPVTATLAILPNNNDALNFPALGDTTVTFKAVDAALATELTSWHPDITAPKFTKAYARFSGVSQFGDPAFDAILCIVKASEKKHKLILHRPGASHVWPSDVQMSYCKKDKLYQFTSDQYTMVIDFGL